MPAKCFDPEPRPEPYLESEYGADYHREAPVKLLDKLLYTDRQFEDEQVCSTRSVPGQCEGQV